MVKGVRMAEVMCDDADKLDESCSDSAAAATTAAGDNDDEEEEEEDNEECDSLDTDADDETFDDTLQLKRFPCIAHTLQLVAKALTKKSVLQ